MRKNNQKKEIKHKLNSDVRFPKVRVIGEFNGEIMSSFEASKIAKEREVDLILINENADPPVVRIEDYNKFIYDQNKKEKELKKNSKKNETKEVKLSLNIADHDLNVKAKKCKEFLTSGDRVKVTLLLKGRQNLMKDNAELVMLKFAQMLSEFGTPESLPKLEGKNFRMFIKPKKS